MGEREAVDIDHPEALTADFSWTAWVPRRNLGAAAGKDEHFFAGGKVLYVTRYPDDLRAAHLGIRDALDRELQP